METFPPRRKGKRWIAVFLLAMAIVHMIVLWQDRELMASGYGDFSAFYTAGLMLRQGMSHQLYSPEAQWRMQQEFAQVVTIRQGPMPYVRPPFEALVFLPLAYFSYPTALAIWSVLKIGILYYALSTLQETGIQPLYPPWLEVVLCLGFFPVFLDLYQGQDSLLLFSLVAVALRNLYLQRDSSAGAVLALGLFKFHLVIPLLAMLSLVGRPRILRGFLPVGMALVAISVGVAGADVLKSYPAYLFELNHAAGVGMVTAQSMPNLRGLLTSMVGRAPYPGPVHWILLPLAIVALAGAVWIWRRDRGPHRLVLGYSLALVTTIVTSYYSYTYDLILLLVPALVLGGRFSQQSQSWTANDRFTICILLLLICSPLYWFLILHLDRPYLVAILVLLLALGIAHLMSLSSVRRFGLHSRRSFVP